MKKMILSGLTAMCCLLITACGSKKADDSQVADVETITVDEVLANPEAMVGDTIVLEGVCSHLCRQGGKKAFVAGSADSLMLRCEAFPLMGTPFPQEVVHHPIAVTGIVREQRIDEDAVLAMEEQNAQRLQQIAETSGEESAKRAAAAESGCDTERKAQGQQDLTTFEERMADYRAKIAARNEKEGKPYLSYYYIDAISYQVLPE